MKLAFNPSTVAALTTPPNNKDITFDLRGRNIFARGVKFYGTDTNTWRDIKINNVSIGSHTLDLQNGSNTTLTNTNGVVTINSTWRPVVDNLTSDSTTSSLSAKQGKVLKALIDSKSNSDHNHDGRYLKLTGGTMAGNALITFADSGSWSTNEKPQGARGGLYWTGQSDYVKLYAEETVRDNLDLVIQFGDDDSNGLSIRNKANTQTSYISSSGVITTGTFKGNLDWSYITNKPATATRWPSWAEVTGKPSSFTPSTHTHGLSNSVFFLNMPSINGNAKWKEVFGYPVNYNLLLSVRINDPAPEWCVGNFGSGILYGGNDTKGFMSSAYNEPFIMWAGGNGSSDDSVPKWYIGIKGTHKSIYNLATIASEANAAYNLRHSHANKSVLDGITSALVNSWNTAYNFVSNITGTDTDKVINKWEEIVNFLAGITEDNKLNTLLNSKLSVYELADNTNVGTIKNNGIYYSTTDASSRTLINPPFNTGFAFINMTSYDVGDDLRRSRLAFNAFGEIKVSDDRDQANTAETWYNVLTSKNSGINGSTIKLNGTSITVYSSGTADGRYVKKSGDTMSGVLTIDTPNFGALTIKRNDDANGASIQFRGKSSVYGYIGLDNSTKDKQFLRWSSDTFRIYTILDTSSTYISNGKGVINGTTITQVDNATNSTNSTNARKLVNWYSARPTSLNAQFGDGSLRIFYATSSTTEGKPAEDSHILHLAWDNTGGYDAQLAVHARSGKVSTRAQNGGTWQPWKTLAFTTDIPSSLKNPYSFNVFGVVYDGSAAKTVTTSTFVSQLPEGYSTVTDGTMFITSWASDSGFADTNAVNVPHKRKAIYLWEYIKTKTDSLYATKGHNHDEKYLKLTGGTMLGALNFANNTWNLVGDDSYIGDCNISGHFGIKAANTTYPGITFFNNASTFLGNLTAYSDNIKYGAYSLQFLDNGNTSVSASTWINPFSDYNSNAVADGQAICVWGQSSYLSNLSLDTGDMSLWLKRISTYEATLNMVLDGEYYANGNQRLAHVSEIPNKDSWNYDDRYLRLTGGWMSGNIYFNVDNSYDIGSNAAASRCIYTNWLGARSGQKLELGANNSAFGQGLCIDTNLNVGIGTNSPTQKLDVIGNIRATGQLYLPTNGNYNAILMGDDCWMGDCNISNVIGLSGTGNANSGGIKFGKGGMYIGYNGSSHYSSGTSLWSNFNADLLDGLHSTSFAPYNGVKFVHDPDANIWHRILQFTTNWVGQVTFMYSPEECQRSYWGIFNINIRNKDIWFRGFSFADLPQIKCCGDDNNNWSVWIKGSANSYDPYGVIQILNFSNASIVSVGLHKSQTTEPSGTYNKAPDLFQAGSVNWSDITNKIVAGNQFNVVNAGYNEQFWFNYLPINDRSNIATISAYCMGNGKRGYASVIASGFIKSGGNKNQLLRADGEVAAFNWAGQSGQPTWLWGGNDFNSYYVYNPSNFRVAYASSAGNADTVDGYHENSFLRYRGATYTDQEATLWSQIGIKQYNNVLPDNLTGVYNYGSVISFPGFNSRFEIYASHQSSNGNGLYYRSGWANDKKAWLKFIDSSNIGSQSVNYANSAGHANSAGNADTLGGIPRNYGKAPFGTIPSIGNDGVMEVGKYIDFHNDNSGSYDYSTRIQATGNYGNTVNLPSASGTLALTSYGGDASTPIFLGYLDLYNGNDGTISSYFHCLGYSVPFTYTRGGAYCYINIPDTSFQTFYIKAAIASVHHSGSGMGQLVGIQRGDGAWWLHCEAVGSNAVQVKGFRSANSHNDSWWGGNPLFLGDGAAKIISVFLFGYVKYK